MHTVSAELLAHMASESPTMANCVWARREDGTIEGFTSHDVDIPYDGVTYLSDGAYTPSALEQSADLAVDNMEAIVNLTSVGMSEADLRSGIYNNAEIRFFSVNYMDLTMGHLPGQRGHLGEMNFNDQSATIEFRSLSQKLAQNIGRIYTIDCDANLGGTRCGIDLDITTDIWLADTVYTAGDYAIASTFDGRKYICTTGGTSGATEPTWDTTVGNATTEGPDTLEWDCEDFSYYEVGTVTSVTNNRVFADSSRAEADGYFTGGLLTWQSGNNEGRTMEVRVYLAASDQFALFEAMPEDIQVGDTYRVHIGCDKSLTACRDTFDNVPNHRGFPYIPGIDKAFAL
jgi:hypothetical protein